MIVFKYVSIYVIRKAFNNLLSRHRSVRRLHQERPLAAQGEVFTLGTGLTWTAGSVSLSILLRHLTSFSTRHKCQNKRPLEKKIYVKIRTKMQTNVYYI